MKEHTIVFGSLEDLELLIEQDASEGLGDTRGLRIRQRLVGRAIYYRCRHVPYGSFMCNPITLHRTIWGKLKVLLFK